VNQVNKPSNSVPYKSPVPCQRHGCLVSINPAPKPSKSVSVGLRNLAETVIASSKASRCPR
jgi:hypothetical protein